MADLVDEVRLTIRERGLLKPGEFVVVAVSGGLDSMVLLRLLDQLARTQHWSLIVAHFNHGLRGGASDRDETLVRTTARHLGWPCVVGWAGQTLRARARGLSLEMAAREARHRFLADVAAQSGATKIALGQHADDQIETVLLRLSRGAGGEGLAGMKWLGPSPANPALQLVRPLLGHTRAALRAFARHNRVRWREDQSNASPDMARNWLRRQIVPRLRRRFGAGLAATVTRTAELVGAEAELVSEWARKWRQAKRRAAFEALHPALQRRVLVQELVACGVDPDFDLVESLRTTPGVPRSVGPNRWALRAADGSVCLRQLGAAARVGPRQRAIRLQGKSGRVVFGRLTLSWRVLRKRGRDRVAPHPRREYFDADRVGPTVWLRHWRPGDRFRPIGQEADVKLQDLFVNARVPREERHGRVIAVAASGELFWVEGLRIAEPFKLTRLTRRWLEWSWMVGPLRTRRRSSVHS